MSYSSIRAVEDWPTAVSLNFGFIPCTGVPVAHVKSKQNYALLEGFPVMKILVGETTHTELIYFLKPDLKA